MEKAARKKAATEPQKPNHHEPQTTNHKQPMRIGAAPLFAKRNV